MSAPTITHRQQTALVLIANQHRRWYAGERGVSPVGRFDVGPPGCAVRHQHQVALLDAGLIQIGTVQELIPTDAGRQLVRDLAIAAGEPDPYPDLAPPTPQETSTTMTITEDLVEAHEANATPADIQALSIPIGDLHPRPENLREDADGTELVHSIVRHGILQPLNVSPRAEGGYWINAGHRRHDGAQRAGLMFLPCIVSDTIASDTDVAFAMLIENLQRRDLNPIEEARGYERLVDLGCNQAEIAEHTGRSASVVSRRLKLLTMPEEAIERVAEGRLPLERADKLMKLDDEVLAIALKQDWNDHRIDAALGKAEEQRTHDAATKAAVAVGLQVLDRDDDGREIRLYGRFKVDGQWCEADRCIVDADGGNEDEEWYPHTDREAIAGLARRDDVWAVMILGGPYGASWDQRRPGIAPVSGGPLPADVQAAHQADLDDAEERRAESGEKAAARKKREAAAAERTQVKAAHYRKFLAGVPDQEVDAKDAARWAMLGFLRLVGREYGKSDLVAEALGWSTGGRSFSRPEWDKRIAGLDAKGLVAAVAVATMVTRSDSEMVDFRNVTCKPAKDAMDLAKQLGYTPPPRAKKAAPAKRAASKTKAA